MASRKMDHAEYQRRVRKLSREALRFTIRDASEALLANPDTDNASYYADEINYCSAELKRRERK